MSGWTKVIVATAIMVAALVAFNLALWRRMNEARRLGEQRQREEAETLSSEEQAE